MARSDKTHEERISELEVDFENLFDCVTKDIVRRGGIMGRSSQGHIFSITPPTYAQQKPQTFWQKLNAYLGR